MSRQLIFLCASVALWLFVIPATAEPIDREIRGKVVAGYQGWFNPAHDLPKPRWTHFGTGGKFEPGHCVIDMWPDTTGFEPSELVPTAFKHADGRVANVFSSANPKTVDRHFAWMKEYGIDGALLQRFAGGVRRWDPKSHTNTVMANVRASAKAHNRLWGVMYDLTGIRKGDIQSVVIPDFKRLASELKVRQDPTYLHHNGKPLVVVWGIGFNDNRDYTLEECRDLVRFLKSDPEVGGNAVAIGVPYYWRTLKSDALKDPLLLEICAEADIVSPWAVGRFGKPEQATRNGKDILTPDLAWAREKKVSYLPVVFPGFTWHNLQKARGKDSPVNQIPRQGGQFLWSQAAAAKSAGAEMIYVAMFDEIDEGTAIMKVSNDPPTGASPFVTYEGLPSDHYLWLTGQIRRMLKGEIPPDSIPKRN